jgi:hypothetical protein
MIPFPLYLTAKSQTEDVLEGFHIGGNDTKKNRSWRNLSCKQLTATTKRSKQREAVHTLGDYILISTAKKLSYKDELEI